MIHLSMREEKQRIVVDKAIITCHEEPSGIVIREGEAH